jgi:hypothetical protein
MPYIGRSTDGFGVRNRFLYLASADDTSVSGADANGATLTFSDGAYVDVYLNGVLLKTGTDYNTNTANTIAGLSAMSANDEVTVIVYDVFTVGDMVSATSGGTFSGAVTANSTLDMNGTELILDADGDTSITADTDDQIDFKVNNIDSFLVGQDYVEVKGVHPDLYIIDTDDGSNNQAGLFYNNGVLSVSADHSNVANNSALKFFTDGTEKLQINANGYVTKPSQPSISVDGNTTSVITDSGSSSYLLTNWTTGNDASFYSQGITYDNSNGRFTVPVAGKYLINVSIYTYQNNVFQRVQLYINGSNNLHFSMDNKTGDGDLGQDNSLSGSTIFNLSANDYIQVYMYKVGSESNKRYYMGAGHSSFSMHLLS